MFLIFVGVIAYIAKEYFPLFRYSMVVFTCLYIGLSFSHPDYWIAKLNLASAEESRNTFFKGEQYSDYDLLGDLNADAASVMLEWMVEEGYTTDSYYIDTMAYDSYRILNEIPLIYDVTNEEECKREQKTWSVYRYLRNLRENCYGQSLREFNLSRFFADCDVLLSESRR